MREIYFVSSLKDVKKIASEVKSWFFNKKLTNILLISGELGAGKTTFIRYLFRSFGVRGRISSPTFILWQSFSKDNLFLHHLDLYRLNDIREILKLDLPLYLQKENHFFCIEWGEKMVQYLQKRKIKYSHLLIIKINQKKRIFDFYL